MKTWKWTTWARGLAAAVISGAASAIVNTVVAPESFNLAEGLEKLAAAAVIMGLWGGAAYLAKSPVPEEGP
jgi:ABC-type branched-subunit amino acid transport system permease subunit